MKHITGVVLFAVCLALTGCGESHHHVHATEITELASEQARAKAPEMPAITFDDEHMPTMGETNAQQSDTDTQVAVDTENTDTSMSADTAETVQTAN